MNYDYEDKSLLFHFACSLTPGIGPLKFQKLKNFFDSYEDAFDSKIDTLSKIVGYKEAVALRQIINEDKIRQLLDKYHTKNIYVIHQASHLYPNKLRSISDPPICLFVKSRFNPEKYFLELNNTVLLAVVGSRKHTTYGRVATENIVSLLATSGILIVSGMALGIDSIAHITTLKNGGKTLAILGCGVDMVYPPENRSLYESIVGSENCIISEFLPGTPPTKGSFIARNRIISGVSTGTIIIEGDERSGSLTTAGFAAEQDRDVFALPGPITSPLSQAPLRLLKSGAFLITQPEDILEFYKLGSKNKTSAIKTELTPEETRIKDSLIKESLFIDDLVKNSGMSIQEVTNTLTGLEIKGIVGRDDFGKYHFLYILT